jgi:hypothetical protein
MRYIGGILSPAGLARKAEYRPSFFSPQQTLIECQLPTLRVDSR